MTRLEPFLRDVHRRSSNRLLHGFPNGPAHHHRGFLFLSGVFRGDRRAAVSALPKGPSVLQSQSLSKLTWRLGAFLMNGSWTLLWLEAPSQYYSSRQTLVGSPCAEMPSNTRLDISNTQSGQLFFVGLPNTYRLPPLEPPMPRLPSYESVRKKDRQRQIHMMIADRFGLHGPMTTEPPPTYEESIRQSVQSLELPFDTPMSSAITPDAQVINPEPMDALPQYETLPQNTSSPGTQAQPD
ncbi:hypothetical protein MHYP_G00155960 [Metynnis hypsauchen]